QGRRPLRLVTGAEGLTVVPPTSQREGQDGVRVGPTSSSHPNQIRQAPMVRRRAGRGLAARRAAIPVYSCFKGAARSRSGFESDAFTQQVVLIVSRVIGTARASVPLKKSCSIIQPINSDRS